MRPSLPRLVVLCLSVAFLVALAVHATSAPVDLSPNSLNFGSQVVGSTSGVSAVSLTNHLSTMLTMSGITTLGDFTQTNNCGNSVATGHSCTIKVTFSPTAIGTRSGQLIVSDNDSTSPQSVQLSGTGSATGLSSISITPVNLTIPFGRQQQFAATGHFKNGSSADLTTSVTWTSSAPTVATISNSIGSQGLATSAKQGTTTVMATLGSLAASTS